MCEIGKRIVTKLKQQKNKREKIIATTKTHEKSQFN